MFPEEFLSRITYSKDVLSAISLTLEEKSFDKSLLETKNNELSIKPIGSASEKESCSCKTTLAFQFSKEILKPYVNCQIYL